MPVLSRIVAAIVGGFAFTSAVIVALPLLPGSKVQWVVGASLLGFALWTAAVVWVFAARSAARAWSGLALASAVALVPVLLVRSWG